MTISENKNSVVVNTGSFILSEKFIRQLNYLGRKIIQCSVLLRIIAVVYYTEFSILKTRHPFLKKSKTKKQTKNSSMSSTNKFQLTLVLKDSSFFQVTQTNLPFSFLIWYNYKSMLHFWHIDLFHLTVLYFYPNCSDHKQV